MERSVSIPMAIFQEFRKPTPHEQTNKKRLGKPEYIVYYLT